VCNERGLFDLQLVQHLRDIAGLSFLVVAAFRVGRETHATQIGNDHSMVFHQHHQPQERRRPATQGRLLRDRRENRDEAAPIAPVVAGGAASTPNKTAIGEEF
jgi:hypothetical protein